MRPIIATCVLLFSSIPSLATMTVDDAAPVGNDMVLFDAKNTSNIYVDSHDAAVASMAAGLLADDFERVSGRRPVVANQSNQLNQNCIVVGTVGQSDLIDQWISQGQIDAKPLKNQWEAFAWQTIMNPIPGVHQALVIAGSDRRGTAHGVMELSKRMGVSPWYWWADVPVIQHERLRITAGNEVTESPGVKYRGIFLNDEDWGLRPWATQTLNPHTPGMGPKTYAKIFELMLRLRLNYIWPAMHPGQGSSEFSTFPGNAELADRWAIVTGSSHCEPMLRNNVFWPKDAGPWRYDVNHDAIFNYWKESAVLHGSYESIWTLGIRGIHDVPMQGPKNLNARVKMVEHTITDQRSLIDQYVKKMNGPPAQCFIPYKEVLPLYDAGMQVPEDVTLVWPDDNYGYVRRLGTPAERKRPGGSGVYYHLSYWGSPHSYLWVESTPPALMWEELRKAYDNDSKTIWIVNVGDIKPAETCIDFFAKLAWKPSAWGPDAQSQFLLDFDERMFGLAGRQVKELQNAYYKLASQRKPESMSYAWADSHSEVFTLQLIQRYESLLEQEKKVAEQIPADRRDTYFETLGYSVRMLGASGLLYLDEPARASGWKNYIDQQTDAYNALGHGKWRGMMSNTMEGLSWPTSVGGTAMTAHAATTRPAGQVVNTIDASAFSKTHSNASTRWETVAGLGWSGSAMTIFPATTEANRSNPSAFLQYDFEIKHATRGSIALHFLPTLRLTPADKLQIAASIDGDTPVVLDIPGGESDNELGKERREGVLTNRVSKSLSTGPLTTGTHTLKISAIDPGVILDQIDFPGDP